MKVAHYNCIRLLGKGGMGSVYLAEDSRYPAEHLQHCVALKVVKLSAANTDQLEAERHGSFLQQALFKRDPRVVEVYELGSDGHHFFVAMEHVPGRDLAEHLEKGAFEPMRAVHFCLEICDILCNAHTLQIEHEGHHIRSVVHGDIKPTNIRIEPSGRVRLLDFGIATSLTETRSIAPNLYASIHYSSPERLRAKQVDAHADLWALGVLLYELVTGRRPFYHPQIDELERMIRQGDPPAPLGTDVPGPIVTILNRALAHEPRDRYGSALEMFQALVMVLETLRVTLASSIGWREDDTQRTPSSNDEDTLKHNNKNTFERAYEQVAPQEQPPERSGLPKAHGGVLTRPTPVEDVSGIEPPRGMEELGQSSKTIQARPGGSKNVGQSTGVSSAMPLSGPSSSTSSGPSSSTSSGPSSGPSSSTSSGPSSGPSSSTSLAPLIESKLKWGETAAGSASSGTSLAPLDEPSQPSRLERLWRNTRRTLIGLCLVAVSVVGLVEWKVNDESAMLATQIVEGQIDCHRAFLAYQELSGRSFLRRRIRSLTSSLEQLCIPEVTAVFRKYRTEEPNLKRSDWQRVSEQASHLVELHDTDRYRAWVAYAQAHILRIDDQTEAAIAQYEAAAALNEGMCDPYLGLMHLYTYGPQKDLDSFLRSRSALIERGCEPLKKHEIFLADLFYFEATDLFKTYDGKALVRARFDLLNRIRGDLLNAKEIFSAHPKVGNASAKLKHIAKLLDTGDRRLEHVTQELYRE